MNYLSRERYCSLRASPAARRCCAWLKIDGEDVKLTQGGDMSAAHTSGAIDTPINRRGCCYRCTAGKNNWFNPEALKFERSRNFVYQVRTHAC